MKHAKPRRQRIAPDTALYRYYTEKDWQNIENIYGDADRRVLRIVEY